MVCSNLINSALIRTNAKDIRQDDLEESDDATSRATTGWMAGNYPGEEGPSIPTRLKGKGKQMVHDPSDGGSTPEERGSSGFGPPQPGSPASMCVLFTP